MDAMTIDLDDAVVDRLQARATRNGRSMEDEILAILAEAVSEQDEPESGHHLTPAD
jgi:plasmid stability protein